MYRSAQEPGNYVSSEMLVLDKPFYIWGFQINRKQKVTCRKSV